MENGYLLQCSGCGSRNRVAHGADGTRRTCSKCGAPLIPSHSLPIEVTDATWDEEITRSQGPAVVEVWGDECGICAQYELSVRHMAVSLFGAARVLQLNADRNPTTARRFDIRGVPTVLLFRDGRLVETLFGPQGERGIREKLGL